MLEIVLRPKKDLSLDRLCTSEGEIFFYPAHAEKRFFSGVGVLNENQLKVALSESGKDMLRFYDISAGYSIFLLLGSSFYKRKLIENFGLKPFSIKKGLIVYYSNNPINLTLKNWEIEKNEKKYDEPFDKYTHGLNPILHLATILPKGIWRRDYIKKNFVTALKHGFLNEWQTVSELEEKAKHAQRDEDRIKSKSILECLREQCECADALLQKHLNRSINDIARYNVELIRDICRIAKASDKDSSLQIFNNFYNVISERASKERIEHQEFPVKLFVNDIEIDFKIYIPPPSTAEHVLNILNNAFEDVKILYSPPPEVYKKWQPNVSLYHFFSGTLKLYHEDYDMIPVIATDLVNSKLNEITEKIGEKSHMDWHMSKRFMRVKKIWIEIEAPKHFDDAIFKAIGSVGWLLTSSEEELGKDRWILKAQIWCNYPLYEFKSEEKLLSIDFDSEKDDALEKLYDGIYDLYFPAKFGMDCSYFFTVLYKEIARKYNYTPMGTIQ
jgi:hypothetical protein